MAVNKTAREQLERIKKNISTSYSYFKDNFRLFNDFRRYVYKESISEQQKTVLQQLSRPITEFNILEAYVSRLLGEFSQHEPSILVSPAEGVPVSQDVIDFVEGHIRYIIHQSNKDSFSYEAYKDILSGGFSVAKVYTDYSSDMSFDQQINLCRVFDPTLCGFDPMARASHKGDGQYCFEIYPMTAEDFQKEYPDVEINNIGYQRNLEEFNWSYKDQQDAKIILVVDYFEKKKKKTTIVKLADGRSMTQKSYERMQAYWQEQQFIEQIPLVVQERKTELETICRYRLIEDRILAYDETDYTYLPLVFIDGNSIILTRGTTNQTYQMTRPYIYHAKGAQDMINYSGMTLCNAMENLVQHKFIVMKEAIPQEQDYIEALNDIQKANTIVVNAFYENNPEQPISTPIREVQNVPLPPEVMQSFQFSSAMTQTILGSYASNIGKNDNDLSGKAVIESASVGNSAAMPYVVGYLQALTQCANIIVDLIPKYLIGKRTLPVVNQDGTRKYQKINQDNAPRVEYESKAIRVNVEAGVNFQVQQSRAVEQIIALTSANETLGKFFTSEKGLNILCKNLKIHGADNLEEAVEEFMQLQQQEQQQMMQMQQQQMMQNPMMIRAQADMAKVQQQAQQSQFDNQIQVAKLSIEKELADAKIIESEAKVSQAQIDSAVRLEESNTSRVDHSLDAATKLAEIKSREHMDNLETHRLAHEIHKTHMERKDNAN